MTSKTYTDSSSNSKTYTNSSTNNNILGVLKDSVVGSGSLTQSTTYMATNTNMAGAGSAITSASLTGNNTRQNAAASSASGAINLNYSMNGQGILQANLNTGAAAVQGNSVALTSTVGGDGGGLSGFSPSATVTPSSR